MTDIARALKQKIVLTRLEEIRDRRALLLAELDGLNRERGKLIRDGRKLELTVRALIESSGQSRERIYEAIRGKHRRPTGAGRRPNGGGPE